VVFKTRSWHRARSRDGGGRQTLTRLLSRVLPAIVTLPIAFAGATAHAAVLPGCSIQISDLRRGYVVGGAGYTTTDLDALQYHVGVSAYDARAALVSYLSSFYLPASPTYREVEGSISLYGSRARSLQAYRTDVTDTMRWHRVGSYTNRSGRHRVDERWHAVAGTVVGDESSAWIAETHEGNRAYSIMFLFFRRGVYLASVRIFGPLHTVTLPQVVPLARLIDRRIQSVCAVE